MSLGTLTLFFLTVFPLICTPGPDILLTASQGLSNGRSAAMNAVAGILLGYSAHAILSAVGIATLIDIAIFVLYTQVAWCLISILLAGQILYSASQRKGGISLPTSSKVSLWRGFFTSFLNPKGLLMYLAILPQFISPTGSPALQAILLSLLFIAGCGLVYTLIGLLAAEAHGSQLSDRVRRRLEAVAGFMLAGAAIKLAKQIQ